MQLEFNLFLPHPHKLDDFDGRFDDEQQAEYEAWMADGDDQ